MKMKYKKLIAALAMAFLLGIKDGYIALWKDGIAEPVEIFPFQAQMLPLEDQHALEEGIRVENSLQLAHLMEDYLS